MKRWGKRLVVVAALLAALLAMGTLYLSQDRSCARLQEAGMIRIGYAVEAPYAFLRPGGDVTGESPEVAKRIVARLGISKIVWVQSEFAFLIPELEDHRFDVIAAGMFITPERAQRIRFSEPTFHVQQALLVPKGNPRQIHSYEQLLRGGDIRIGVLDGSVEKGLLRRMGLPERQLVCVPDALAGRVAVESGVADCLALSSPAIQWMVLREQLGKTEMASPFEQPVLALKEKLGFGGFGFNQADRKLLSAWNTALKAFIGTPDHLRLISEFGFGEGELPKGMTSAEVLSRP